MKELLSQRPRWIDKSNSETDQGVTSEVIEVAVEAEGTSEVIEVAVEAEGATMVIEARGEKDQVITAKVILLSFREERIDESYKYMWCINSSTPLSITNY